MYYSLEGVVLVEAGFNVNVNEVQPSVGFYSCDGFAITDSW